jgi:hypothetical protein
VKTALKEKRFQDVEDIKNENFWEEQEVLGITNSLLSFYTTRTAQKTKNIKGETTTV